jgi:hypothetical protein
MACHRLSGEIEGWLCLPNIYNYGGFIFEYHNYMGAIHLNKKTLNHSQRTPNKFWDVVDDFLKIKEKEEFLIYG